MRWTLGWLLAFPFAAVAQGPLLNRVMIAVRDNVEHLPNYTCTMTVDRSHRRVTSKVFQPVDKVRLEVAMVDNRELYAWAGSRHFEEQPVYNLLGDGMISTGDFGLFIQTVFLSGTAKFQFAGRETLNERQAYHFLYEVPRALSHYEIRLPTSKDTVGFGGSVWVDAVSLDLVRLEILVREIPEHLALASGRILIDYGRMRMDSGNFLLPKSVEQNFVSSGMEARNQTSFSACREYKTGSTISFADAPKMSAPQPNEPKPLPPEVPAGIEIESKLETQFDSVLVARGDPFEATVTAAVRLKGSVVVPKGAKIGGRVTGIVRSEEPFPCIGLILQPAWIEFEGRHGAFAADQISLPYMNPSHVAHDLCPFVPEPGSAVLQFHGSTFHTAGGQPLLWRTVKPDDQ
ncbi:MAG TPA: hypothetical protein VLY24_17130 [Bryobacteraceae bacterium]|nr:hypothetical protein [Bryobacteraceae bacterium]